jgi:hypothetical protein
MAGEYFVICTLVVNVLDADMLSECLQQVAAERSQSRAVGLGDGCGGDEMGS